MDRQRVLCIADHPEMIELIGLHVAGMDGFITKPFGPDELMVCVERVLGTSASPGTA